MHGLHGCCDVTLGVQPPFCVDGRAYLHTVLAMALQAASSLSSQLMLNCRACHVSFAAVTRALATGSMQRSAETLLASLTSTNWEQQGIPTNAGVASQPGAFDLGRMQRLMAALGHPELTWPAVHIAGSKGKGSTATLLSGVLHAAGYKVGLYTSPHLHHLGERISISNTPLSPQQLDDLVHKYHQVLTAQQSAEQGQLSHFEIVTALAFRQFADSCVDVAVVETGMGGATDATNIFSKDNLLASVITALGYEHVEALGGTIESIAAAKAGIMKPGRPVVVAKQEHPEALSVLVQSAQQKGCSLLKADEQVAVQHHSYHLVDQPSSTVLRERVSVSPLPGAATDLPLPTADLDMCMVGAAQHSNLQTAITVCGELQRQGWRISGDALVQGLQRAYLPGRMQLLRMDSAQTGNLQSSAPQPEVFLLLDGAHSPESAASLASSVRSVFPDSPVALVVAMAADKEHRAILGALRQIEPCTVVFTTVAIAGSYNRSAAPGMLTAQWEAAAISGPRSRPGSPRCRVLIQASIQAAVERALSEVRSAVSARTGAGTGEGSHQGKGVVIVTGSLHAVAGTQRLDSVAELLARAAHNQQ